MINVQLIQEMWCIKFGERKVFNLFLKQPMEEFRIAQIVRERIPNGINIIIFHPTEFRSTKHNGGSIVSSASWTVTQTQQDEGIVHGGWYE